MSVLFDNDICPTILASRVSLSIITLVILVLFPNIFFVLLAHDAGHLWT